MDVEYLIVGGGGGGRLDGGGGGGGFRTGTGLSLARSAKGTSGGDSSIAGDGVLQRWQKLVDFQH